MRAGEHQAGALLVAVLMVEGAMGEGEMVVDLEEAAAWEAATAVAVPVEVVKEEANKEEMAMAVACPEVAVKAREAIAVAAAEEIEVE